MDQFRNTLDAVSASDDLKRSTLAALRAKAAETNAWPEEERPTEDQLPEWAREQGTPAPKPLPLPKKGRVRPVRIMPRWVAAIAACLCLVVLGFGGVGIYQTPTSFISVDVNPSLELSVNAFDRVIDVTAYNEDANAVLSEVDVEGMDYREAIETLVASDALKPYLTKTADLTLTYVSSEKDDAISAALADVLSRAKDQGLASTTVLAQSDEDTMKQAHAHQCSVGKYAAYLELASYDESVTVEACADMTMHEIHDSIDAHKHGHDTDQDTSSEEGHHDSCSEEDDHE